MRYVVDLLVLLFLLCSFPIAVYIFAGERVTFRGIMAMLSKYKYHLYILILFAVLKTIVLHLEAPVENMFSMDFTRMIYEVEGNKVLWIQRGLYHPWLTVFMCFIYLGSFAFILIFSVVLFAYIGKSKIASQLVFMYLMLLLLSIPFYLFVIVYCPSYPKMIYPGAGSIVKGIEPLFYNFNPHVNDFIVAHDTFNNCFPSMHIGYPFAILLLLLRRVRGFVRYKLFLFVMLILIAVATIYLGIHWILDIFAGLAIGVAGFLIADRYAYPFWKRIHRFRKKAEHRKKS